MFKIVAYTDKYEDQTIQLILSVLEDELGYKGLDRPDLHNIKDFYQKDDKGNFWLAIKDGEIVGTIALQHYGKQRAMIKRMCVKKEFRGKGIGKKLLKTLLEFAKNSGHKTIYSTTMKEFVAARNLYKGNNFIEIDKLPEDLAMPGEDIYLELKI